jgi:hypothetical protein
MSLHKNIYFIVKYYVKKKNITTKYQLDTNSLNTILNI